MRRRSHWKRRLRGALSLPSGHLRDDAVFDDRFGVPAVRLGEVRTFDDHMDGRFERLGADLLGLVEHIVRLKDLDSLAGGYGFLERLLGLEVDAGVHEWLLGSD